MRIDATYRPKSLRSRQEKRSESAYQKPIWKNRRKAHIENHPECKECKDAGRGYVTGSRQNKRSGKTFVRNSVDHVIPWKSGQTYQEQYDLFTKGELQTLCPKCHAKKTREDERNYQLYPSML